MGSIVLTLIGEDRPGLVRAVAEKLAARGGNWLDARMARLAGQFAGIVLAEAPERELDGLKEELSALADQGLSIIIRETQGPKEPPQQSLLLQLLAQDRPGIVRDITQVLATLGVNIEELTTTVSSGSFSGERMFQASARLRLPPDVPVSQLQQVLEQLGNELMVDISLGSTGKRE